MPRFLVRLFAVFSVVLLLQACERQPTTNYLDQIKDSGELRVGTLYSHQTFFYNQDGLESGLEYDLLTQLAQSLGVTLRMIPLISQEELFKAMNNDQVDLLAAGLSPTRKNRVFFRYSPHIYKVNSHLVYRRGSNRPRTLEEIDDTVWLLRNSYNEQLLEESIDGDETIEIKFADYDENELLRQIAEQEISYALVNDSNLMIQRRSYPELSSALTLEEDLGIVWYMSRERDDSFYSTVLDFVGKRHIDGTIAKLYQRYLSYIEDFDYVDTRAFVRAVDDRLPKYQAWFEQYAGTLDWRLLAAVGYQESHWKADAVSPTGVRGIMMLTNPTAKSVGVKDRTDPEQSIRGGATYLQQLIGRVPETIPEDEKIWFALASYNIGFGHVLDARLLTRMQGADDNSWDEVKERLPLLMQRKWHRQTRYGYARGKEAYHYVTNIQMYYQNLLLLLNQQQEQQRIEELAILEQQKLDLAAELAASQMAAAEQGMQYGHEIFNLDFQLTTLSDASSAETQDVQSVENEMGKAVDPIESADDSIDKLEKNSQ
ncbi:membrane-bound lytic murein transglycosylase MltF [Alginatibacterium sediminis]|uniref:membrane-bound lytic murein transglycosylase MltF n=1 Tax=Alginatibacterium sediminis TaxID=2164068 RepID=UPI0013142DED|nr:membrane-bound lytic murein transglycosylase MltF [Alginatibacterium sediminis]